MKFTVSAFLIALGGVKAFSPAPDSASFVVSSVSRGAAPTVSFVAQHTTGCSCAACSSRRRPMVLFSDATSADAATEDVPVEVEALDGIADEDEAHNAERPARKSLKKKGPKGKPLSEFNVGDSVTARVKAIASYGAFMDIGAQTDGLLHISQLSTDFVANVNEILKVGQEIDVRITVIDEKKNQVGLSLLTKAEEDEAKERASQPRQQRERPQSNRRDDAAVQGQLVEKGWDTNKFVEGTVVSVVDFGAFVRLDASQLNSEVEGQLDGLVHISALANARVDSVSSVVNLDDKVQVRVKDIANSKVSLTMVSADDEKAKIEATGNAPPPAGNKNWKDDLKKMQGDMPEFHNRPQVVDLRK